MFMYEASVFNVNFDLLASDCLIGEFLQMYILFLLSYFLRLTNDLEKRTVAVEQEEELLCVPCGSRYAAMAELYYWKF